MAGSRVTQIYAEAIGEGALARVTQVYAEAIGEGTANFVTQLSAEVIGAGGPDFTWSECMGFLEERFPTDVAAAGTAGGPGFSTLQTRVRSGWSQRIGEWEEELGRWDVSAGINTIGKLIEVRSLYAVAHGPRDGFRFKDPLDYATWQWVEQVPGVIGATDMQIGTGDGATTKYQLTVTRTYGGSTTTKTIYKPVAATVKVAVNDVEIFTWTLDDTTGVITFDAAPGAGESVKWGGEYDKPVHFSEDTLLMSHDREANLVSSLVVLEELRRLDTL
jgi:uncharacterized protein (TIGR02217 family)